MPTTAFRYLSLLSLVLVHGGSYAASAHEQSQLSLVPRQVDAIERLATRADTASTSDSVEHYRYDYPRLT